jgi:hypothetical protein
MNVLCKCGIVKRCTWWVSKWFRLSAPSKWMNALSLSHAGTGDRKKQAKHTHTPADIARPTGLPLSRVSNLLASPRPTNQNQCILRSKSTMIYILMLPDHLLSFSHTLFIFSSSQKMCSHMHAPLIFQINDLMHHLGSVIFSSVATLRRRCAHICTHRWSFRSMTWCTTWEV